MKKEKFPTASAITEVLYDRQKINSFILTKSEKGIYIFCKYNLENINNVVQIGSISAC